MIYKIFFLLLFCSTTLTLHSQKHKVEVFTKKNKDSYVLNAKNNSNVQQEVTLTLTVKNLRGYKNPITKLVPANSTKEIVTLTFIKGKANKVTTRYTYKPKPTQEEINLRKKQLEEKAIENVGDVSKGIVVFSKDGCSRCHYATSYLLDNHIDFKLLNTTENKDYKKLMWILLRKNLPASDLKSVIMPVILIDGELSYNMKNLKTFVANLKKNN